MSPVKALTRPPALPPAHALRSPPNLPPQVQGRINKLKNLESSEREKMFPNITIMNMSNVTMDERAMPPSAPPASPPPPALPPPPPSPPPPPEFPPAFYIWTFQLLVAGDVETFLAMYMGMYQARRTLGIARTCACCHTYTRARSSVQHTHG